jgi:glycosyltransferase involved in cell wall biosynthesis
VKKVLVAIATFNREEVLFKTLRSISKARLSAHAEIHLFDDASDALSWDRVRSHFPWIKEIHLSEKNRGPDGNIIRILEYFSSSDFSHLLFLDSDCIVRQDVFDFVADLPDEAKTVWSAYRSRFHSECGQTSPSFVQKASLGALGMVLSRDQIETFLSEGRPEAKAVDWQIVFFFRARGFRFLAPVESRIEHIGWEGAHNKIGSPDRSIGFEATNAQDAELISDLFEALRQHRSLKTRCLDLYKTRMNSILRFRVRSALRALGI